MKAIDPPGLSVTRGFGKRRKWTLDVHAHVSTGHLKENRLSRLASG